MKAQILIRRFDPVRDADALRSCIIDQQDFHRSLESTWPKGPTIVADYLAYLDTTCATRDGCILMAEAEHFARSRGAVTLRLGVLARNEPARAFYLRRAFREYFQVLTKTLD